MKNSQIPVGVRLDVGDRVDFSQALVAKAVLIQSLTRAASFFMESLT